MTGDDCRTTDDGQPSSRITNHAALK